MARSITIEDLYQMQFLSRPRISPDGQRVAFVDTTIDGEKHTYRSSVWIAPVAGGEARRFTFGSANASSPVWSPRASQKSGASSNQARASRGEAEKWRS